jgi:hypothetical protein
MSPKYLAMMTRCDAVCGGSEGEGTGDREVSATLSGGGGVATGAEKKKG